MSISIRGLAVKKYPKHSRQQILDWVYDWEKNDEHDLDLCIGLKDDAYRIFASMLTKKERVKIDKKLKETNPEEPDNCEHPAIKRNGVCMSCGKRV